MRKASITKEVKLGTSQGDLGSIYTCRDNGACTGGERVLRGKTITKEECESDDSYRVSRGHEE